MAAYTTRQQIELQKLATGPSAVPEAFVVACDSRASTRHDVETTEDSETNNDIYSPEQQTTNPIGQEQEEEQEDSPIPKWPFICLILQHFSSSWTDRSYEFAAYLYLVILFPTSLVPASLMGLIVTGTGLVASGWVGGLVDVRRRLSFVRGAIMAQKVSIAISYALFIILFLPLRDATAASWAISPSLIEGRSGSTTAAQRGLVYLLLALIIVASSVAGLASGGLNVAVQRDWVVTIAGSSTRNLTTLNTQLRRIDLICKLVAPLVVSAFTTALSYPISLYIVLSVTVISLFIELIWIGVVWRNFSVLSAEERERVAAREERHSEAEDGGVKTLARRWKATKRAWIQMCRDWKEFVELPVFLSSLAISLVYLTTLSFDGIMLSYLKSQRGFSDPFIAGMRGLAVVMGLIGTAVMPQLERRMGLVRGGAWSLWSEFLCLVPPVITLYVGLPSASPPGMGAKWNIALFFTFISLSRIGLWSFDLIQLQTLQEVLRDHPRRNRLTALQLSLQSAFDLGKYGLVLGLNKPEEFKWTALVSLICVLAAGLVYTAFIQRTRGHLHHWTWLGGKKAAPITSTSTMPGEGGAEEPSKDRRTRSWGEGLRIRARPAGPK